MWVDAHPKLCYLFALVAGPLARVEVRMLQSAAAAGAAAVPCPQDVLAAAAS